MLFRLTSPTAKAVIKEINASMVKTNFIPYNQIFHRSKSSSSILSDVVKEPFPHQTSLARLPVPPLKQTLERYLRTVKPVVSDGDYSVTEILTKEFETGLGRRLQIILEEKARHEDSWLADWWLHHAYLGNRMPLPVHSSPGMIGPLQNFKGQDGQLKFAAKMIASILDYKIMIDNKTIPIDMQGKIPLDMTQYYKVFSTCRIPGLSTDSLVYCSESVKPPTHICVAHNNHFFKVCVYGNDHKPLNESQILAQLKAVVQQSVHRKDPIGVLTTEDRKTWALAYKELSKGKVNKDSLKVIERSMFMVCLDKKVENASILNKETDAAMQTIHGYGAVKGNTGNRWFDKTLQFIVGQEGEFGVSYEHSPAEGPPIANILDHIVSYVQNSKGQKLLPSADVPSPIRLKFVLSDSSMQDIVTASEDFNIMIDDIEMSCFKYKGYGKEFIKKQKMSPDSYIQMAMQLAFYKIHGCVGATYESGSTRQFLHGRTEVIRSTSLESKKFCEVISDKSASDEEKVFALRAAVESHKSYTIQAVNGQGVDRHLMGLKLTAIENGLNVPDLFMDTGFITSSHFKISSSQVSAKCDAVMCYGPLVPDGYGCCYNPRPDSINFGTSACNSNPETFSGSFMQTLDESLTNMHDILVKTDKSKL